MHYLFAPFCRAVSVVRHPADSRSGGLRSQRPPRAGQSHLHHVLHGIGKLVQWDTQQSRPAGKSDWQASWLHLLPCACVLFLLVFSGGGEGIITFNVVLPTVAIYFCSPYLQPGCFWGGAGRDKDPREGGGGGHETIPKTTTLSPPERFCSKLGSVVSHFNVSWIVRGKVSVWGKKYEEKGELIEVEQTFSHLLLSQTSSHLLYGQFQYFHNHVK